MIDVGYRRRILNVWFKRRRRPRKRTKKAKERVEARNALENYVYQIRNSINDNEKLGSKISEDDRSTIEDTIKESIEWLEQNQSAEKDEFDEKYKEVEKVVQPIFSKLYGAAGGPGAHGGDDDMPSHDEL